MKPAAIKGLDLVLAGGIRTVPKLGDQRESTVVLVRGAAGAGKTIFASHLAISEAAAHKGDVVYCCVELLPTELDAQLSNITFGSEQLAVPVLYGETEIESASAPRVLASIIDIPPEFEPDFGSELRRSMEAARAAGLDPRVLVVDSLSEGYRLGAGASRPLADALSKFAAEEGVVLVLIEEVSDNEDSLWTFIADVVFELFHRGTLGTAAAEHRSLVVRKSRFGPSHVGPHSFTIQRSGGIEIYPRISNYLADWARERLPREISGDQPVRWNLGDPGLHLPDPGEVVLLTGTGTIGVAITATHLLRGCKVLRLELERVGDMHDDDELLLQCGDPFLSGELLLSRFCQRLEQLRHRISAIAIGDLGSIRDNLDPTALRRTLPVLISIAHRAGLAVLLFETATQTSQATAIHLSDTVIVTQYTHHPDDLLDLSIFSRHRRFAGTQLRIKRPR